MIIFYTNEQKPIILNNSKYLQNHIQATTKFTPPIFGTVPACPLLAWIVCPSLTLLHLHSDSERTRETQRPSNNDQQGQRSEKLYCTRKNKWPSPNALRDKAHV